MIPKTESTKQILRLSGLKGFDKLTQEGLSEIVDTLAQSASNENHAKAFADTWLRASRWFPVPADVFEFAASTAQHYANKQWDDCPSCMGSGFRPTYRLATWTNGHITQEPISREQYRNLYPKVAGIGQQECYAGVEYCRDCAQGRHLLELRKREQVEA
jgi:hypothetical protein